MINEGILIISRNGRYNEIQNYWFAPLEHQYESEIFNKVFFYVIIPSIFIIFLVFSWLWSLRKMVVIKTAELQKSEKRYTLTLEAINDGLWDLHINTGKTFFSPQYYRMAGYNPGDFPTDIENWLSRIHKSDIDRVKEALFNTLIDGKVK
jgi:PAS domain-containing protein